jgi:mono/diheme cytochrome c family protein
MSMTAVVLLSALAVGAAPPAQRDLASEVQVVFKLRCASCHGPNLTRPRGGFGYVLDLRRMASNRELVVPSKPDTSPLWTVIQNEEMPPPGSPSGPLTRKEREVIRAWIAAGAPPAERRRMRRAPQR